MWEIVAVGLFVYKGSVYGCWIGCHLYACLLYKHTVCFGVSVSGLCVASVALQQTLVVVGVLPGQGQTRKGWCWLQWEKEGELEEING